LVSAGVNPEAADDETGDGGVDWETSGVGDPSGANVADSELNRRAMADLLIEASASSASEASRAASVSSRASSDHVGAIGANDHGAVSSVSPPAVPAVMETFDECLARLGWHSEPLGSSSPARNTRRKRRRTDTVRTTSSLLYLPVAACSGLYVVQRTGTVMCRFDGSAPVKEYQNADLLVNAFWWLFWRGQGAYDSRQFDF
jgi:hypothetical protein